MEKIDLHMHSTVSDGTDTPQELLRRVREAGIRLFALTDHDALKGCAMIRKVRSAGDPRLLNGVEFSCQDEQGKYHILGYHYDLVPEHYMILAKNDDKPGMIGQMGTLLGAAHVNIANMQVARKPKTGNAMMIMTVDSPVEKATLQMIAGLDGIQSADFVTL